MDKVIDGNLLRGSLKREFIVKVRPFSSAKTVNMQDYYKPIKRDFRPSLRILHIDTNDLSLKDTLEVISKRIIATAESLKKLHNKVAISNIIVREDNLTEKGKTLNNVLIDECNRKNIPIIPIIEHKSTDTS